VVLSLRSETKGITLEDMQRKKTRYRVSLRPPEADGTLSPLFRQLCDVKTQMVPASRFFHPLPKRHSPALGLPFARGKNPACAEIEFRICFASEKSTLPETIRLCIAARSEYTLGSLSVTRKRIAFDQCGSVCLEQTELVKPRKWNLHRFLRSRVVRLWRSTGTGSHGLPGVNPASCRRPLHRCAFQSRPYPSDSLASPNRDPVLHRRTGIVVSIPQFFAVVHDGRAAAGSINTRHQLRNFVVVLAVRGSRIGTVSCRDW